LTYVDWAARAEQDRVERWVRWMVWAVRQEYHRKHGLQTRSIPLGRIKARDAQDACETFRKALLRSQHSKEAPPLEAMTATEER
jgi:hypothetical protein